MLAIITYALHVCGSDRKDNAFNLLDGLAVIDGRAKLILYVNRSSLNCTDCVIFDELRGTSTQVRLLLFSITMAVSKSMNY